MNKFYFGYSTKNIPIQGRWEYKKDLIINQEAVARRIRWKAYHALDPNAKKSEVKSYGFKSRATPPLVNHATAKAKIAAFEREFFGLVRKIEFRKVRSEFQTVLKKDQEKIKSSEDIIARSDKTGNHYSVPVDEFKKMRRDAVCAEYKQCDSGEVRAVNERAAAIANNLQIADRVECHSEAESTIFIKDAFELSITTTIARWIITVILFTNADKWA